MLELDDIQSGVLRPRPTPYAATYIGLRIDDRGRSTSASSIFRHSQIGPRFRGTRYRFRRNQILRVVYSRWQWRKKRI